MAITVYTYNDKVLKNAATDKWLTKYVDPLNPLGLSLNTMRLKLSSGTSFSGSGPAICIDETNNIWDWTWSESLSAKNPGNIVEVLGINMNGVTSLNGAFVNCSNLTHIAVENINTSNVTDFYNLAYGCSSISVIPDFDVSSATDVTYMFNGCTGVESGALAMYNKLAALGDQITAKGTATPYNTLPFYNCGSDTVTGAAELAQIPASWGGTGA